MPEHVASRTLVKSAPELWAECSDPASLARHLGAFGEIRITKLEPETAVAWEGEDVRGTVTLEPAGWGTRVILTALEEGSATAGTAPAAGGVPAQEPAQEPAVAVPSPDIEEPAVAEEELKVPVVEEEPPVAEEEPPVVPDPPPAPRPGFFARLFGRRRGAEKPRVDGNSDPVPPDPEAADDPPAAALPTRRRQVSAPPQPDPEPPAPPAPQASALVEALDSLGRAHHRPYSRG